MKKRSPIVVLLLSIITLGIYALYWMVTTKGEMTKKGADIPTAWLLLTVFIPIIGFFVVLFWLYKYSVGVEHVTGGKTPAILAFLLLWILPIVGYPVVQAAFNKVGDGAPAASEPTAPTEPTAPSEPTPPADSTPPAPTEPAAPAPTPPAPAA